MDAINALFSPADGSKLPGGPGGGGGGAGGAAINGPFYLLREAAGTTDLTGSSNLITHYNLEHAYNKFCGKKVKDKLSNFLPDLPGMIDLPGTQDNSSLRSLIEKPPICGNSFTLLTGTLLTGFRLHTGPLPEQYRLMHIQPPRKKSRHKHKHSRAQDPVPPGEGSFLRFRGRFSGRRMTPVVLGSILSPQGSFQKL
ncbi:mediator of RNA polymerase II transcription subunit 19-A-like [Rhinoraja longicauda]